MAGTEYGVFNTQDHTYDFSSGVGYFSSNGGFTATAQNLAQKTYPPASQILGGGVMIVSPNITQDTQIQVVCLDANGAVIPGSSLPSEYMGNSSLRAKYMFDQPLPQGSVISWQVNSSSLSSPFVSCIGTVVV